MCAEWLSNDLRGREKKYFMFLNDLWFSSSHSQFYQRRQEGFPDLSLQNRRVFLSPISHDHSEWPLDFGIPIC